MRPPAKDEVERLVTVRLVRVVVPNDEVAAWRFPKNVDVPRVSET